MKFSRRSLLRGAGAAGVAGVFGTAALSGSAGAAPEASRSADWGDQPEPEPYDEYTTRRVPEDYETIQAAVNDAEPRDLVLVGPGVYNERVEVNDTPRLTIRGIDRNEVVLDGEYGGYTGITITSDDVVVENLTVRHWEYGVYWVGVEGYRGSHITAYNNTEYGIYAFNARYGRFEHCYSSGCDDAGFYIGQSQPADAVITDCIAEYNAMGYSGTNAGGNLVISDSVWRNNMSGIVPNTLDSQDQAPQGNVAGGIRVENNEIYDNNNLNAPAYSLAYPPFGNGITVAGGDTKRHRRQRDSRPGQIRHCGHTDHRRQLLAGAGERYRPQHRRGIGSGRPRARRAGLEQSIRGQRVRRVPAGRHREPRRQHRRPVGLPPDGQRFRPDHARRLPQR